MLFFFQENRASIVFHMTCMNDEALFSEKNKNILKLCLLIFKLSMRRVKTYCPILDTEDVSEIKYIA